MTGVQTCALPIWIALPASQALGLAVERIRAARAAIDAAGSAFVLTARTDALLLSSGDGLKAALRRAGLYREAGADCVYAPGASDLEAIRALVQETGAPVNVVLGLTGGALDVPTLLQAGVARISLGGSIARAALGFVRRTMAELRDRGSIGFAAGQIPQGELNVLFARAREQSNG